MKRKRDIKVEFIGQRLLTDEEALDPRAGAAQAACAFDYSRCYSRRLQQFGLRSE